MAERHGEVVNVKNILLAVVAFSAGLARAEDWKTLSGGNSGILEFKTVVVEDAKSWRQIWTSHAPGKPAPEVDFSKEMVVGVFLGERPSAGYSVDLEIKETGKPVRTVVGYREKTPKDGGIGAEVLTYPFALAKIPARGDVNFENPKPQEAKKSAAGPDADFKALEAEKRSIKLSEQMRDALAWDRKDGSLLLAKASPAAILRDLPPPPGQQQGGKNLPPPPGDQDNGKPLPPPPGQDNGKPLPPPPGGGNGGKPLPPPPVYRPRPSQAPARRPSNVDYYDGSPSVLGNWRVARDGWGNQVEDFGSWKQSVGTAALRRGGSETGVGQATRYSAELASQQFRRRYVLYWRWVGYDCDPNNSDNCARWESQHGWFYDGDQYGASSRMTVVAEFDQDKPLLPWEKETLELTYDGGRVGVRLTDASFNYAVKGPIIDQEHGTATLTLTPGARNKRMPEANAVTARIAGDGRGGLKLVVTDSRGAFYAGETIELVLLVKKDSGHWYKKDPVIYQATGSSPVRVQLPADAKSPYQAEFSLGYASGKIRIESWGFRRAGSAISLSSWIDRGRGNEISQ